MIIKGNSLLSKGWLIIGIVLILTGTYLIYITDSLYYATNQLDEYPNNGAEYKLIKDATNRVSLNALFLIITSLIILAIGVIMCLEWILFSKFLQRYSEK